MVFTIVSLALIPIIILIVLLYAVDRYDKEPVKLLSKVFLFGVLSSIPVIAIQSVLIRINVFAGLAGILFQAFITAALTEEYMKRFVVLKTAFRHPAFNEKLDGIIYCTFASLGFAATENVLYLFKYYSSNPSVFIYRAIFSVPGHMLFAITMGYYLSLSKFTNDKNLCRKYYRKSLIYPVFLHGAFNFILMADVFTLIIFVPFVIFLWVYNMKKLNKFYNDSKAHHL